MKFYAVLLISLFCSQIHAQSESVQVLTRQYIEYVPSLEEPCKDDTSKYWLMHEIDFEYPKLKSSDPKTDSVFNALVTQQVIYAHPYSYEYEVDLSQDSVNVHDNYCYHDTPFRTGLNYELIQLDTNIISLEFYFYDEACCGGHGFRGRDIPFTYDLKQQKEIRLDDIVADKQPFLKMLNDSLQPVFVEKMVDPAEQFSVSDMDMGFSVKENRIKLAIEYPSNSGSPPFVFCYITLAPEQYAGLLREGLAFLKGEGN